MAKHDKPAIGLWSSSDNYEEWPSLPIEEWRHLPALAEATEASWLSDRPAVVVVCTRVRDHLPALLDELAELRAYRNRTNKPMPSTLRSSLPSLIREHFLKMREAADELAELRNLATFVATKLRLEEEASSDGLPCKAMSARDEALSALAKHAGPWSPECAALSTYTMLDQACRENTEMLDELADLRAYRERTEAALAEQCQRIVDHGSCAACMTMRDFGLWREPKANKLQP